jgi:hypothetical protein
LHIATEHRQPGRALDDPTDAVDARAVETRRGRPRKWPDRSVVAPAGRDWNDRDPAALDRRRKHGRGGHPATDAFGERKQFVGAPWRHCRGHGTCSGTWDRAIYDPGPSGGFPAGDWCVQTVPEHFRASRCQTPREPTIERRRAAPLVGGSGSRRPRDPRLTRRSGELGIAVRAAEAGVASPGAPVGDVLRRGGGCPGREDDLVGSACRRTSLAIDAPVTSWSWRR